jgi:hypothetical protein
MIRTLIFWSILILIAGAAYTFFGILTFEPERPAPLQFDTVETLIARNQEQLKSQGQETQIALSPDQEQRKMQLVTEVQKVVTSYENAIASMPAAAIPVVQVMTEYTRTGALPPMYVLDPINVRTYNFNADHVISSADYPGPKMDCEGNVGLGMPGENEVPASIMIGNEEGNSLNCNVKAADESIPRIMVAGPGDDFLTNAGATVIMVPGSGTDHMKVGGGSQVFLFLEEGWGSDKLDIDCSTANIDLTKLPATMTYPWTYPYKHFIVFSPRVAPGDVAWDAAGTSLANIRTGDKLATTGKCLNLIFLQPSAATQQP